MLTWPVAAYLRCLGIWACWGMTLACITLVILAIARIEGWTFAIKLVVGSGALYPLGVMLKKSPANPYARAASLIGRVQLGLMLCIEAVAILAFFLFPDQEVVLAGGLLTAVTFVLHIAVGIWGSHRLGGIEETLGAA